MFNDRKVQNMVMSHPNVASGAIKCCVFLQSGGSYVPLPVGRSMLLSAVGPSMHCEVGMPRVWFVTRFG